MKLDRTASARKNSTTFIMAGHGNHPIALDPALQRYNRKDLITLSNISQLQEQRQSRWHGNLKNQANEAQRCGSTDTSTSDGLAEQQESPSHTWLQSQHWLASWPTQPT
jgi:hypothetical protein